MGRIVSIVYTPDGVDPRPPDHYARVPVAAATLTAGRGIDGDRKGAGRGRQLNVMAAHTLAQLRAEGLKTEPGEMGEQIVVEGVDADGLAAGTRLRLGDEAILEVAQPRTGCARFQHIQSRPPSAVSGRLGVMARVVVGGVIRVGDAVEILLETPASATSAFPENRETL
jgi:MOSC domain-containing protein YiiM